MNDNIKAGSDIHAGDGGYQIGTQAAYDRFVANREKSSKSRIRRLVASVDTDTSGKWMSIDNAEKLIELVVKECAYLVNHQQRTTGYTTHVRMLCDQFGIEYVEEDYYGDGNDVDA